MEKEILRIIELIKKGEVVVIPVDSSYALVADLTNQKAVEKLDQLKKDRGNKLYSAFLADVKAIYQWCKVKKAQNYLLKANLPGPFTFILELLPGRFKTLAAQTLGIKVIKNFPIQEICQALNIPISATSCNPSDLPPARTIEEAKNYFGKEVAFYFDAGEIPICPPSTVIDIADFPEKPFNILREGPAQIEIPPELK